MKSRYFNSGFLLLHLPHQLLFLLSPYSLSFFPFLLLDPHDPHLSLCYDAPEVALEFDDAVHASLESTSCDETSAPTLELKDSLSHCSVISSKLTSPECCLQPCKTSSHLNE